MGKKPANDCKYPGDLTENDMPNVNVKLDQEDCGERKTSTILSPRGELGLAGRAGKKKDWGRQKKNPCFL